MIKVVTNAGYIIIEHLSFDEFLISIFPFHLNLWLDTDFCNMCFGDNSPFSSKSFQTPPLRPPISNTIQKTKLLTLNKKTFMYLWICTAQVCWHICFLCIILKYDRAPINIWLKVILNNATFTCGKTSYYLGVMQLKIDLTVFCMYKIYLFWIVLKWKRNKQQTLMCGTGPPPWGTAGLGSTLN